MWQICGNKEEKKKRICCCLTVVTFPFRFVISAADNHVSRMCILTNNPNYSRNRRTKNKTNVMNARETVTTLRLYGREDITIMTCVRFCFSFLFRTSSVRHSFCFRFQWIFRIRGWTSIARSPIVQNSNRYFRFCFSSNWKSDDEFGFIAAKRIEKKAGEKCHRQFDFQFQLVYHFFMWCAFSIIPLGVSARKSRAFCTEINSADDKVVVHLVRLFSFAGWQLPFLFIYLFFFSFPSFDEYKIIWRRNHKWLCLSMTSASGRWSFINE